ncbi:MAG: hypothetical protein R2816_00235 [Flavobacteriaceae bacterium]
MAKKLVEKETIIKLEIKDNWMEILMHQHILASHGSGGGGNGYGLRGRGRPTNSKVVPECDEEGSVVVKIEVNRNGNVISTDPGQRGTTGAICLYEAAKKTAMTLQIYQPILKRLQNKLVL